MSKKEVFMKGKVGLENLPIDCIVGHLKEEQSMEQRLLLSVAWELSLDRVTHSDDLLDTVDYVAVADLCRKVAIGGKFRMIEALAATLFQELMAKYRFSWLEVKVNKPAVGAFAYVEGKFA
jgi:7,8-dihydroneopterin aldolase/epimerase/oxygenase